MHITLSIPKLLLLLPLFPTLIIATPTPYEIQPGADGDPLRLPNYVSSAAFRTLNGKVDVFYYQSADGAIHEASTRADVNYPFDDFVILKPGGARKGTPLAAVDLGSFNIVGFCRPFPFLFVFRDPLPF